MCYSALVVQTARKLNRQFGLKLDYVESERIFSRRLEDSGITISRGFEANFEDPQNDAERRIKALIDEHRTRQATKFEQDLFSQKTRLVNAERALKGKETKKAREDVRIATNKIETLTRKLSDLRRTETSIRDNRIFPMVYGGVIVRQGSDNLLTPMRYFCRPAGNPPSMTGSFRAYTTRGATTSRNSGPSSSVATTPSWWWTAFTKTSVAM